MTSLMNTSSTTSHGKNSVDEKIPNPLLHSICTPTDSTANNVSAKVARENWSSEKFNYLAMKLFLSLY